MQHKRGETFGFTSLVLYHGIYPAVKTAGYPYNVPNGTNMPEALDKDSQPFQWLGVTQVRMYYYSPRCGSGVFDFLGPKGLESR